MSDAPDWEDMTDWSGLPEVYLTKVQRQKGMFWRVEACSVPMAIGPEVPLAVRHPAVLAGLLEVKAMIAAAVEGAAYKSEEFEHIAEERDWRDGASQARKLAAAIRASIPADAKAALDAYVAAKMREARNAALREAAATAERLTEEAIGLLDSDGYPVSAWMAGITVSIRALIEEDKP